MVGKFTKEGVFAQFRAATNDTYPTTAESNAAERTPRYALPSSFASVGAMF